MRLLEDIVMMRVLYTKDFHVRVAVLHLRGLIYYPVRLTIVGKTFGWSVQATDTGRALFPKLVTLRAVA